MSWLGFDILYRIYACFFTCFGRKTSTTLCILTIETSLFSRINPAVQDKMFHVLNLVLTRGVTTGGVGRGVSHPPPQSLSEIHSSGKSQKVGLYDIKIHQGAVKYYQLCCERWERKLQTFHDVADIAFKNRFILPTTYKCLPQSV